MTERERKILMGEDIQPRTADEITYANVSGGGGVLDVELSQTNSLDKTYAEIKSAADSGMVVRLKRISGKGPGLYAWNYLAEIGIYGSDDGSAFAVTFANPDDVSGGFHFEAGSENEYPAKI